MENVSIAIPSDFARCNGEVERLLEHLGDRFLFNLLVIKAKKKHKFLPVEPEVYKTRPKSDSPLVRVFFSSMFALLNDREVFLSSLNFKATVVPNTSGRSKSSSWITCDHLISIMVKIC